MCIRDSLQRLRILPLQPFDRQHPSAKRVHRQPNRIPFPLTLTVVTSLPNAGVRTPPNTCCRFIPGARSPAS
ncbi:MAG: hypothetical protein N2508_14800, partial [Anaerolineae bacterium]|nr:hypothetical protein [Anaerolineae bacterium]